jgi:hypothetical protein
MQMFYLHRYDIGDDVSQKVTPFYGEEWCHQGAKNLFLALLPPFSGVCRPSNFVVGVGEEV